MHTTNYDTFFNSHFSGLARFVAWSCASSLRTFRIASMFLHFCFISFYFVSMGFFSPHFLLQNIFFFFFCVVECVLPDHHTLRISFETNVSSAYTSSPSPSSLLLSLSLLFIIISSISCFTYKTVRGSYALMRRWKANTAWIYWLL